MFFNLNKSCTEITSFSLFIIYIIFITQPRGSQSWVLFQKEIRI
jgi:hypothetical protein